MKKFIKFLLLDKIFLCSVILHIISLIISVLAVILYIVNHTVLIDSTILLINIFFNYLSLPIFDKLQTDWYDYNDGRYDMNILESKLYLTMQLITIVMFTLIYLVVFI